MVPDPAWFYPDQDPDPTAFQKLEPDPAGSTTLLQTAGNVRKDNIFHSRQTSYLYLSITLNSDGIGQDQ